ncbi:MAG: threonylcarbamoyl-AMP synthase [Clostridiales Family XIII bacterium]|jgi:L-threonylcarbamoyladenylate synthase|nr:threonylcarbamoyl-AMP synthase [Clostridiales Family XIII bacterium]
MTSQIFEPNGEGIQAAAAVLRRGGIVAFPTETVYGLGADAFNEEAVRRIYAVKGRPADNPSIVHIARASDIGLLTPAVAPDVVRLADAFWPGPLTMIVEKRPEVPGVTTGGLATVGVRLPDSDIARALIRAAGSPVAAPSANPSGRPSPTAAAHVLADFEGARPGAGLAPDAVLRGPDCRIGIESTVVDMTASPPAVLRPGYVTAYDLSNVLGVDVTDAREGGGEEGAAPKAPGMKYRHYAPEAEMLVIEGAREKVESEIGRLKTLNEGIGRRVGVMLFEEEAYMRAAHDFFARLRALDREGVDLILAGALPMADGLGFAVMNRMMKAAGYNIVKV